MYGSFDSTSPRATLGRRETDEWTSSITTPESRNALVAGAVGLIGGLGGGIATMAGPQAYPKTPPVVWEALFWVGTALFLGAVAYLLYEYIVRPRLAGKPKVDPLQIIAIIAAVVLTFALILQWWRGPQPDPRIVQLESQVSALTAQLASRSQQDQKTAKPEASLDPLPVGVLIPSRYYSTKNKEDVAAFLDKISDQFNRAGSEIFLLAETAINRSAWERPAENMEPHIKRLDNIADLAKKMRASLYEDLLENEREYRVEMNKILFPIEPLINFQREAKHFHAGLSVWSKMRDSVSRDQILELVHGSRISFAVARNDFLKWMEKSRELIDETRRALKK